nr:hypothetical protein [Tanacetum cinerariifolium]
MSNINNSMQTRTSNLLHNAIMEASSKDRPPMLAPGNYIQWKSRIKRYIDTKPNRELIYYCLENLPYELGWNNKPILDSEGNPTSATERVIDNDIYSTVDACPNACEMWKAIERLKQDIKAGGEDRPPMLAPGNYVQWKSRIKRYIDTKPNHELIHYCLKNPLYKYTWADKVVPVSEGSSETTTKRYMENYKNVSQDIRDQLNAEVEAVQIILTGIEIDIYSTVDACPNACEMWKAIERLKQGESINVQDLETNLYWEFGKFTSRDGESLESYYSMFYKMMNELVRNQCDNQELKTVSYHKLYDILKQHQNEVNEIRAERLARTANPLGLVAQQQPVYHPQNHLTHYTQNSSTRTQQAAIRNRGKAIVNSPPPIYDQEPSMVAKDDEMSKDKEIDKLMALISLSFKKIYKPTNNNHQTSSNTSRASQDNSPRISRGTGYDNKRIGNVAGARETVEQADWRDDTDDEYEDQELEEHYMETVGSTVVQKYGIQCFNCKEFGHVARECQKPKRAKHVAYHREKMLLCKQEEARIQLNAEQAD